MGRLREVVRRQKLTQRRAALAATAASVAILASTYVSARPARALDLLPPVAIADTLTTTHSRTRVVPAPGVLANDLDLDGGTVAVLVSGTSHGTVTLRSDGGYTYTPTTGFVGSDQFSYRARSGGLLGSLTSLPATVSITVTNTLPNLAPDAYNVAADTTRFVAAPGALANDSDADGDALSAALVTSVSHGSVSLATSGAFAYTPASGYAGTDEFTYRAWDGAAWSKPTAVSLSVFAPATPAPTNPPKPTPSPTRTPGPTPTRTPVSTRPTAQTPRPSGRPNPTPNPTRSPASSNVPGIGSAGGPAEPGAPGNLAEPLGVRPVRVGFNDAVFGDFAGFGGIEWAVPALALGVPGLIVIVALLAQGLIGVIWLTYARRRLKGLGVRLLARSGRAVR
jgi:Big-like domain-containing protein